MARKIFFVAPVCVILVGAVFILSCTFTSPTPSMFCIERTGTLTKVIDGDTLVVDNEHIRLVGINAPEWRSGSDEAKEFIENLCLGKVVGLNIDDLQPRDCYDRTLAVVYVNGMNLNAELLRKGYAEVWFCPPSEFNPYRWLE